MDETFQLRARRLLGDRQPAPLDFSVLAASLAAQQSASPAARAQAHAPPAAPRPGEVHPLTEIVLAGPEWRTAASAQCGCFSRAEAGRRRNVP